MKFPPFGGRLAVRNADRCSRRALVLGLFCGLSTISGCGGGGSAPQQQSSQAPGPAPAAVAAAPVEPAPAAPQVDPNKKETKWIGEIPYDVFYDQPLTIAADTSRVGGTVPASLTSTTPAGNAGSEAASMTKPPGAGETPSAAPAASSSAVAWQQIIPMPVLVEVVKEIRTRLTGNLQTVATYNKSAAAISTDGTILAAMAAIAAKHPEELNWKANAKYVRDLGYDIYSNAGPSGRDPWMKSKEPFDQAVVVIDGGNPPARDSADDVPLAEAVYASEMMKQIEVLFNSLKANINTDARLKEDPAKIDREMRLMAALGTIMTDHSYDNAVEKKYQDYFKTFIDGALEGAAATKAQDFAGFQAALNKIQTTCSECHQQFRGADTGF